MQQGIGPRMTMILSTSQAADRHAIDSPDEVQDVSGSKAQMETAENRREQWTGEL